MIEKKIIFSSISEWQCVLKQHENNIHSIMLNSEYFGDESKTYELIIEKLINTGCQWFYCTGCNSELLHDYIDDQILAIQEAKGTELDILTTWHSDEPIDETANLFVSMASTEGYSVFFLHPDDKNDISMKLNINSVDTD